MGNISNTADLQTMPFQTELIIATISFQINLLAGCGKIHTKKSNFLLWRHPFLKYNGLNLQVKLPANLWLSNYPADVQNIQIDFQDGLGLRIVSQNTLINVAYGAANTYTWHYKLTLTNGQTLCSHSKIEIEGGLLTTAYVPTGISRTAQPSVARNPLAPYEKIVITSSTPYNNRYGSATVYIRYAIGGNNTINRRWRL